MPVIDVVGAILRRDRAVTIAGLCLAIGLAWIYLILMPMPDNGMGGMVMLEPMPVAWTVYYALLMFVMWVVMNAAMMLPGAAPAILLVAALARHQDARGKAPVSAGAFALGYLAVWTGFSALAVALQWRLDQMALMDSNIAMASVKLAGTLLVAAGVYQWTPLKRTCLTHCRSPLDVITRYWLPGRVGALSAGVRHGLYCAGCCGFLMALLFVGGVMNLAWVAAVSVLVLGEKLAPGGQLLSWLIGVGLVIWGSLVLFNAVGV